MSDIDSGLPVASANLLASGAARAAGFDMKIHPHLLRHSCGYKLANDGELAPTRFKSLFRD